MLTEITGLAEVNEAQVSSFIPVLKADMLSSTECSEGPSRILPYCCVPPLSWVHYFPGLQLFRPLQQLTY